MPSVFLESNGILTMERQSIKSIVFLEAWYNLLLLSLHFSFFESNNVGNMNKINVEFCIFIGIDSNW